MTAVVPAAAVPTAAVLRLMTLPLCLPPSAVWVMMLSLSYYPALVVNSPFAVPVVASSIERALPEFSRWIVRRISFVLGFVLEFLALLLPAAAGLIFALALLLLRHRVGQHPLVALPIAESRHFPRNFCKHPHSLVVLPLVPRHPTAHPRRLAAADPPAVPPLRVNPKSFYKFFPSEVVLLVATIMVSQVPVSDVVPPPVATIGLVFLPIDFPNYYYPTFRRILPLAAAAAPPQGTDSPVVVVVVVGVVLAAAAASIPAVPAQLHPQCCSPPPHSSPHSHSPPPHYSHRHQNSLR
mmetsp:Transcript_42586/g.89374  ORF Transcript_42586/g.89374 Transcript_42586/m.89374 type:complete len:295 (-) Transcript_42586:1958-2842(-)